MSKKLPGDPAFIPKSLVITDGAENGLSKSDIKTAFNKHSACDWGMTDNPGWLQNDEALKSGDKLVSEHLSSSGEPFMLITEADRSSTSVILQNENCLKRAC